MHVDHITARADGGSDDHSNLRTLCARHHAQRTAVDQGIGGPHNYHGVKR
jgi:5-methylcytosine-specific restriction endonuclease McrA